MYPLISLLCLFGITTAIAVPTNTTSPSNWNQTIATLNTTSGELIKINYIEALPPPSTTQKGTILLIHGWPETSYQYRKVIPALSAAGYRIIVPDYRGAGKSSRPATGYSKSQMASDLHILLHSHLDIAGKVHVVGNDIGAMIAWAYAARYANDTASVIWGEAPIPGTTLFQQLMGAAVTWHFAFNGVRDLPEALTQGRERTYIEHFYREHSVVADFLSETDVVEYATSYAQAGAMRAGFELYRAFEADDRENREWIERNGKVVVPTLAMFGGEGLLASSAGGQLEESTVEGDVFLVPGAGHYIAEENPEGWVEGVLGFVGRF